MWNDIGLYGHGSNNKIFDWYKSTVNRTSLRFWKQETMETAGADPGFLENERPNYFIS